MNLDYECITKVRKGRYSPSVKIIPSSPNLQLFHVELATISEFKENKQTLFRYFLNIRQRKIFKLWELRYHKKNFLKLAKNRRNSLHEYTYFGTVAWFFDCFVSNKKI